MKFKKIVKMHNDPHHIISKKILQGKFSAYEHQGNKLLDKIYNQGTWEKVKGILVGSRKL